MDDLRDLSRLLLSGAGATIMAGGGAENTRRQYARVLRAWRAWCGHHAITPVPASAHYVAAYLAERAALGAAPSTVRSDRAGIAAAHRMADEPDPTGAEVVHAVLRRIDVECGERGRGQVDGLTWEHVDLIVSTLGSAAADIRDAALIRIGSDGMLRVAELAALGWDDITRRDDGSGVLLIRRSKTDQTGRGLLRYVGAPTIAALERWRQVAAGSSIAGITAGSISRMLRRRAADVGIRGRISGHSLRVGAAQSLAVAGATLVEMQLAGGWRTTTSPAHYARAAAAERGAVARLRYRATA